MTGRPILSTFYLLFSDCRISILWKRRCFSEMSWLFAVLWWLLLMTGARVVRSILIVFYVKYFSTVSMLLRTVLSLHEAENRATSLSLNAAASFSSSGARTACLGLFTCTSCWTPNLCNVRTFLSNPFCVPVLYPWLCLFHINLSSFHTS